ncbi:MAG: hypothetical protein ACYC5X_05460 [Syntrophales bacterium]
MMVKDRKDHRFAVEIEHLQRITDWKAPLPSQLFHHQDIFQAVNSAPPVEQKGMFNTLNYIHFTNGMVMVHASDPQYGEDLLLKAHLDACQPGEIVCRWAEGSTPLPDGATIPHVIVSDGLSLILLPIRVITLHENGFTAGLPVKGYLLGKRRIKRHAAQGIDVGLTQSGFLARGELIDFNPLAFRVRLVPDAGGSFIWLNAQSQCMIYLQNGQKILFSGPCRCIRQTGSLFERELVLEPLGQEIQRFQKKKLRNPRLRVTPAPCAHFEHPFIGKQIQRDILDLTFTGFAVEEKICEEVLMPGMIIPGLEIRYAGALKMTCDAQVIYRKVIGEDLVRYGLAILDMDFRTYRHLSHIMVHTGDPHARFSSMVEMDALWEFLFDTGFIYPKKYHLLQSSRDEFKETYRKLYQEDQEIEAHFTYEYNGRIYGHASIFRAYQRTWMVHHLAARPLNGKRTGLFVLKNILRFFDGLYRYPSIQMDHMLFYFRPENHFPNLFFGGFARDLNNQRACSLDLFTYICHPTDQQQADFPQGWQLTDFETRHLPELERFYRHASGGLLLDVLRLGQTDEENQPLEEVYRQHGFLRQWRLYSLTHDQALKALLIVNHSSPGLNLSELLNSIKVIVTAPTELPWTILTKALSRLTPEFETEKVPLLIYPADYPSQQGLIVEKQYLLWILDTQYGKEYLEYMEKKTKLTLRFLFKHLLRKFVPK